MTDKEKEQLAQTVLTMKVPRFTMKYDDQWRLVLLEFIFNHPKRGRHLNTRAVTAGMFYTMWTQGFFSGQGDNELPLVNEKKIMKYKL